MTTVECGLLVTIDISQVEPGSGESWIPGNPTINWGDGITTTNVSGTTANHTYTSIGKYTIVLAGTNTCNDHCIHSEDIVRIINPSNLRVTDIKTNGATIGWENVFGRDSYAWELFHGTDLIDSGKTTDTYIVLSGLDTNTGYTISISAVVDTLYSCDFCGDCFIDFTTLPDTCRSPACSFTAHT